MPLSIYGASDSEYVVWVPDGLERSELRQVLRRPPCGWAFVAIGVINVDVRGRKAAGGL